MLLSTISNLQSNEQSPQQRVGNNRVIDLRIKPTVVRLFIHLYTPFVKSITSCSVLIPPRLLNQGLVLEIVRGRRPQLVTGQDPHLVGRRSRGTYLGNPKLKASGNKMS